VGVVRNFIKRGYSDERVLSQFISREEIKDLVSNAFQKTGHFPWQDQHFARDFIPLLYEFFLPNLATPSSYCIMPFSPLVTLPFDLESRIGSGGYGEVYRAKLLEGYHDFETRVSVLSSCRCVFSL